METVNTPATVDTGKHFTPEQVEQIVKERLTRDREARKDENATKAAELEQKLTEAQTALQSANTTIQTLQGTSATAEEITAKVKGSWEKIQTALPADKLKLVPAKYSEAEKIEYVADNKELFFPTAAVPQPNTAEIVNPQGTGGDPKYGGFRSLVEWAQAKPQEYAQARRAGKV